MSGKPEFFTKSRLQEHIYNLASEMQLQKAVYNLKMLAQRVPDNNDGLRNQLIAKRKRILDLYEGDKSKAMALLTGRIAELTSQAGNSPLELYTPNDILNRALQYMAMNISHFIREIDEEFPPHVDELILSKTWGDVHQGNSIYHASRKDVKSAKKPSIRGTTADSGVDGQSAGDI